MSLTSSNSLWKAISLPLVAAAGVASACVLTPAPTEPLPEESTALPTETQAAIHPAEPTLEVPSPNDSPEPPADDTVWRHCDRAWVNNISLSDVGAGWAMVDCSQDVGIRTLTTEHLYRLADAQWQSVDVAPEGLPGEPGAYSCLWDISAVGPEEMWAVGMTHGVYGCQSGNWLVHYRNGEWEAIELEEEIAELDETFFLEHYDGLLAIDMLDADNGWVTGYGLIYRYNRGQWSLDLDLPSETAGTFSYPSGDEDAFRAISMANVDSGWAGGIGPLYRYQQGAWTRWEDPLFDSATVNDIEAVLADEAWAVGHREVNGASDNPHSVPLLWHFIDGQWQNIPLPIEEGALREISMEDAEEGWAVGWTPDSDILLHYVDAQWQVVSSPSGRALSSVAAAGFGRVWIGGADGLYQYVSPDNWNHADLGISAFSTGILEVDIAYDGDWFREVYNYSPQAENVRHYVLVIPESQHLTYQIPAFRAFHLLTDWGREEFSWAFDYLYEAPAGHFSEEFVPGTYYVAAAFVVAHESLAEAAPGEGTSLGPGIGGASTDYQEIVIEPGQTRSITFHITDENGWACPWLYIYDGQRFVRMTEILREHRGSESERTEVSRIGPVRIANDNVILRVAEEQAEIAFIDQLYLVVDGVRVVAESDPQIAAKVAERDHDYLILTRGESCELIFGMPASVASGESVDVLVVASGFYVPLE